MIQARLLILLFKLCKRLIPFRYEILCLFIFINLIFFIMEAIFPFVFGIVIGFALAVLLRNRLRILKPTGKSGGGGSLQGTSSEDKGRKERE